MNVEFNLIKERNHWAKRFTVFSINIFCINISFRVTLLYQSWYTIVFYSAK